MYDLIIIGGGPAGLNAAIYAERYKLKTLLIAKKLGGLLEDTVAIENYMGFDSISGYELTKKIIQQVKLLDIDIQHEEVTGIKKEKDTFIVNNYKAKKIILALGTNRRKLDVPGEKEFLGKGVCYCAICDAPLFKGKTVAVIGGNDSAAKAALLIAEHVKKVYIIYRKENIRAEPILLDRIKANKKIEILNNANVTKINGDKFVNSVELDNKKIIKLDGVFVEIGYEPNTQLAAKLGVKLDGKEIDVNPCMQTNIKGVYAVGDITNASCGLRQIITAAAEGAVAAFNIYEELKK